MGTIGTKTVGELVATDYRAADVFKKYGIDFCCGGNVSLQELCSKKNLDFAEIEGDLQTIDSQFNKSYNFNKWDLGFLIDYIINVHHSYVLENIPIITQYADKVAKVHGHHRKETVEISKLFKMVSEELRDHMQKEENILFPYIKMQVGAKKNGLPMPKASFGTVENPIGMMETEHENAGKAFRDIGTLSNDYNPPPEACNTYKVLYAKLHEFEEDLHRHVHLENNILFPKAIKLERHKS